jgi:hypothetical protein
VENIADESGGGVNLCDIYNCIIISNSAAFGGGDIFDSEGSTFYTCSPDVIHGESGSITNDPFLVDIVAGNYHLAVDSPCVNAGNNAYVSALTDLDGNARFFGADVDMGAYELQQSVSDLDGDGMDDAWENAYFVDGTNAQPHANGDSDPFDNLQEFIAGTDPTNGASFFAVTNWMAGDRVLQWPMATSRLYTVWWSTNLAAGFQPLAPAVASPGNSFTDAVHTATDAGYYKVEVEIQ